VIQAGGVSTTADTTELILTFNTDPSSLTSDNITVTGATKGTLTGSGLSRTLTVFDITVPNGEPVSITVTSPAGYLISNPTLSTAVYRELSIGKSYLGGNIAYLLKAGDAGYDENICHGLILSDIDLSTNCNWSNPSNCTTSIGATGTAIGTGRANTDLIVAQNGPGNYAAYLARIYDGGGFTDWYLPSRDELLEVRCNIVLIPSCYRTSSEADAENTYVVWQDFFIGAEFKGGGRYVCAIRDF
jgi:hypothetical protein